jgi:hypothetical protein
MNSLIRVAVNPPRQRLIDEMEMRRLGRETQRNYIRDVRRFPWFLGKRPTRRRRRRRCGAYRSSSASSAYQCTP